MIHVIVEAPPWRDPAWPGITGCNQVAADVSGETVSVAEWDARAAGDPRAPLCGVCWWAMNGAARKARASWRDDPVAVVLADGTKARRTPRRGRLAAELRALAALVAAHPEDFAALARDETILAALGAIGSPR